VLDDSFFGDGAQIRGLRDGDIIVLREPAAQSFCRHNREDVYCGRRDVHRGDGALVPTLRYYRAARFSINSFKNCFEK
jgi:hypothetical protein